MRDLVVRIYDVRFGDAILVMVPDEEQGQPVTRTILFDVGNAFSTDGGDDTVFGPIVDDILAVLDGAPLDLYVMTHEHLDHVQGLFYAATALDKHVTAKQAWLTGSAEPGYYDQPGHEQAHQQRKAAIARFRQLAARLLAAGAPSPFVGALLANNDTRNTGKCVTHLRTELAPAGGVQYVDRTSDLSALQPAASATITLWAPEENTADYYGRFSGVAEATGAPGQDEDDTEAGGRDGRAGSAPIPPAGVDAGAFYNLLDARQDLGTATLLRIDAAANNTSVVLHLEWRGWRLLFPGDAEKRSWRTMDREGVISPIHFLKISHHGSQTGIPPAAILDKLLPVPAPDDRHRRAAVSTYRDTYPGVPDDDGLRVLTDRVELQSTLDLAPGQLFFDVVFPADGRVER